MGFKKLIDKGNMAKRKWKKNKIKIIERKLGKEKAWGQAWQGDNIIEIDERLSPSKKITIYCHELLHLADINMPEYKVEKISQFIGKGLWQAGYRKIQE